MNEFLQKNYYWLAGLLTMAVASVVAIVKSAWTMSREHQRLQKIQEDIAEIKEAQKKFMTADDHLKIQQINNNAMHQEFDEKYRRLTAVVLDEITTTNANICKLLERQGLKPVDQSSRNRRITDYLENSRHE
jgi:predicted transcriptional regulator